MEGDIEELRRDPLAVAGLGLTEIVDHYDRIVRELDQPPIDSMGHSFGGLITQILIDRGLGAAGVAIDPAPIKGIRRFRSPSSSRRSPRSRIRSTSIALSRSRCPQFNYGFTNYLSEEETRPIYERYAVPGPSPSCSWASPTSIRTRPRRSTSTTTSARRFSSSPAARTTPCGGGDPGELQAVPVLHRHYGVHGISGSHALDDWPARLEDVADYALDWASRHIAVAH